MGMFRTATFLFVVGQFVFVKSQSHIAEPSMKERIRDEIFGIVQMQTKALWSGTPSDQNIEFLPLSIAAGWQMMLMQHYYGSPPGKFSYKNDFLKKAYALAGILDKMSSTSNAKLKFVNSVFYDQSKTSKQLLNDLKTYYHAEAYEVSFNSEAAILAVMNERFSNVTKGRIPKMETLPKLHKLLGYSENLDKLYQIIEIQKLERRIRNRDVQREGNNWLLQKRRTKIRSHQIAFQKRRIRHDGSVT
ncbi:uncharacterized protein LOC135845033 [Planococcus citri]|uniref:uncharacterized protein LOC135845033 n=1 Tax=Planococcus citri TaxID=170843 RepID=UPI0031F8E307